MMHSREYVAPAVFSQPLQRKHCRGWPRCREDGQELISYPDFQDF